jgi:hypothetical protein
MNGSGTGAKAFETRVDRKPREAVIPSLAGWFLASLFRLVLEERMVPDSNHFNRAGSDCCQRPGGTANGNRSCTITIARPIIGGSKTRQGGGLSEGPYCVTNV